MRIGLALIIIAFVIAGCGKTETKQQDKVGNITVPSGVTMRSYSTSEPNFDTGNCTVTVTVLPESQMEIIKYVWIENFQAGLKPTVEKLKVLPAVVFDNVAEQDAKRITANLKLLGCSAEYEFKKHE